MAVLTWHREKSFLASGWYRAENYSPVLPDLRRRPASGAPGGSGATTSGGPRPREAARPWAPDKAVAAEWGQRVRPVPGSGSDAGRDEQLEAQLPKLQTAEPDHESTDPVVPQQTSLDCNATIASTKLAELSLYGVRISNAEFVKILSARRGLRSLLVAECEIADLSPVLALEGLRELKAARCSPGVTEDFVASLQALKKLEVLDLSFCPGATDHSLAELCRGCRALTDVELCSCPGVSDAGVLALALANPCLQGLSLALNNEGLTAEGVARALQRTRRLRRLDLSGCPQLHFAVQPALVRHCEYVEDLSFASCAEISNEDVRQILTRCTHLERLNLTGCSGITEEVLLEAVPQARRLRWLALSAVPEVSAEALEALRGSCPNLSIERHSEGPKDPRDLSYVLPPPRAKPKDRSKSKARSTSRRRSSTRRSTRR